MKKLSIAVIGVAVALAAYCILTYNKRVVTGLNQDNALISGEKLGRGAAVSNQPQRYAVPDVQSADVELESLYRNILVSVVDSNQTPVLGASVYCYLDRPPESIDEPTLVPVSRTGKGGKVKIQLPRDKTVCVLARMAGLGTTGFQMSFERADVLRMESVGLEIVEGALLRVLVLDLDGNRQSGVLISATPLGSGVAFGVQRKLKKNAVSNLNGLALLVIDAHTRYRLRGTIAGKGRVLYTTTLVAPSLAPQGAYSCEVELEGRYKLTGRVLDDRGFVVANAKVFLLAAAFSLTVQSDMNGEFEFHPLSPGKMTLFSTPEARAYSEDIHVEVGGNSHNEIQIDVRLLPEAKLRGRVVTVSGIPIEGALVRAFQDSGKSGDRRCLTSSDGEFEINGLIRDAMYSVSCWPKPEQSQLEKRVSVNLNGQDTTIIVEDRFLSPATVQLRVLEGDSGLAVEDYMCFLVTYEGGRQIGDAIRVHESGGRVKLEGLLAGNKYAVDVFRKDVRFVRGTPFVARENEVRTETVWLRPKCQLQGIVRMTGYRAHEVSVHLLTAGHGEPLLLTELGLNKASEFRLRVAPAAYTIRIVRRADGKLLADRQVTLSQSGLFVEFALKQSDLTSK